MPVLPRAAQQRPRRGMLATGGRRRAAGGAARERRTGLGRAPSVRPMSCVQDYFEVMRTVGYLTTQS